MIKSYPRLHIKYQHKITGRWYMMWTVHLVLREKDEGAPHMWQDWGHFSTQGELWSAVAKWTRQTKPLRVETTVVILEEIGYNRAPYIQYRL